MCFVLFICTYLEPFTRYSQFQRTGEEKVYISLEGIANFFITLDLLMLTFHLKFDFSRTVWQKMIFNYKYLIRLFFSLTMLADFISLVSHYPENSFRFGRLFRWSKILPFRPPRLRFCRPSGTASEIAWAEVVAVVAVVTVVVAAVAGRSEAD